MLETINEEILILKHKIGGSMRYVSEDELYKMYNSLTDITSMILDESDKRSKKV